MILLFIITGLILVYSFIVGLCGCHNLTLKEGIIHLINKFKKKKETYPWDNVDFGGLEFNRTIGYIAGVDPVNTRNDNISIYDYSNTLPTGTLVKHLPYRPINPNNIWGNYVIDRFANVIATIDEEGFARTTDNTIIGYCVFDNNFPYVNTPSLYAPISYPPITFHTPKISDRKQFKLNRNDKLG